MNIKMIRWIVLLLIWMMLQSSHAASASDTGDKNTRNFSLKPHATSVKKVTFPYSTEYLPLNTTIKPKKNLNLPSGLQEQPLPIPDSATILFLGILLLKSARAFRNKSIRPESN